MRSILAVVVMMAMLSLVAGAGEKKANTAPGKTPPKIKDDKDRDKDGDGDKRTDRDRDKDRDKSRDRNRGDDKDRNQDKDRGVDRDKDRGRDKDRDKGRDGDRDKDKNKGKGENASNRGDIPPGITKQGDEKIEKWENSRGQLKKDSDDKDNRKRSNKAGR